MNNNPEIDPGLQALIDGYALLEAGIQPEDLPSVLPPSPTGVEEFPFRDARGIYRSRRRKSRRRKSRRRKSSRRKSSRRRTSRKRTSRKGKSRRKSSKYIILY